MTDFRPPTWLSDEDYVPYRNYANPDGDFRGLEDSYRQSRAGAYFWSSMVLGFFAAFTSATCVGLAIKEMWATAIVVGGISSILWIACLFHGFQASRFLRD